MTSNISGWRAAMIPKIKRCVLNSERQGSGCGPKAKRHGSGCGPKTFFATLRIIGSHGPGGNGCSSSSRPTLVPPKTLVTNEANFSRDMFNVSEAVCVAAFMIDTPWSEALERVLMVYGQGMAFKTIAPALSIEI